MDILEHRKVKLSILDENEKKVDLVGDTIIDLEPAFSASPKQGYDQWHELTYKGKYAGEVYLEMTFYPAKPALPPKRKAKKNPRALRSTNSTPVLNTSTSPRCLPQPLPQPGSEPGLDSFSKSRPLPYPEEILSMSTLGAVLPSTVSNPKVDPGYRGDRIPDGLNSSQGSFDGTGSFHSQSRKSFPDSASSSFNSTTSSAAYESARTSHNSHRNSMNRSSGSQNVHYRSGGLSGFQIPSTSHSKSSTQQKVKRKPVGIVTHSYNDSFDPNDETLSMPFSPDDYESFSPVAAKPKRKSLPARPDGFKPDELIHQKYYHPEPPARSTLPPLPTEIEPGLGGYHGSGQWDISKQLNDGYSDSVYNKAVDHKLPRLPPKIPMGLTEDEYLAVEYNKDHFY